MSEVGRGITNGTAGWGRRGYRSVGDDRLGREEQRGDRRGVLQRGTRHLGRVDDAFLEHVDVLTRRGVETLADRQRANLLHDDPTLEAGVERDLLDRGLERDLDDLCA